MNNQLSHKPVTSDEFRHIISHLGSGVSIITVRHNEQDYGITASAVCSVSLDPPMLLVCVNQNTGIQQALMQAKSFNVHILGKHQADLALQFSRTHTDKFHSLEYAYSELGNPLLPNVVAQIECQLFKEISAGTHSIFVGEIHQAQANDLEPLIYVKGKFGEFSNLNIQK